jgi:hypothetical protein
MESRLCIDVHIELRRQFRPRSYPTTITGTRSADISTLVASRQRRSRLNNVAVLLDAGSFVST